MSVTSELPPQRRYLMPAIGTIGLVTLLAGTADLLSAIIVYAWFLGKVTAVQILQGITATAVGKDLFAAGAAMTWFGVFIHYCIAFTFACVYFFIYPTIPFLAKYRIISGVLYGLVVWIIMNMVIVPLRTGAVFHFHFIPAARSAVILMIAFGPLVSLITQKYCSGNK